MEIPCIAIEPLTSAINSINYIPACVVDMPLDPWPKLTNFRDSILLMIAAAACLLVLSAIEPYQIYLVAK